MISKKIFEADLEGYNYLYGVSKGWWGEAEIETLPKNTAWPEKFFWLKPAFRPDAPDRYYIKIDLTGYRVEPPTGSFWDPTKKEMLSKENYPIGKPGSRFSLVFRTDWGPGLCKAFYHPYDRFTVKNYPNWRDIMPNKIWSEKKTIANYLEEFYKLLNCNDYYGINK